MPQPCAVQKQEQTDNLKKIQDKLTFEKEHLNNSRYEGKKSIRICIDSTLL